QNTYSHYSGVDALREAIAVKALEYNGIKANPDPTEGNILVTAGATGAFVGVFNALVNPGDEVIFFEPFYRYNVNLLALCGDGARHTSLATLPGMADRTVTITSFSKTLAITGWRIGYAIAPPEVTKRMGLVNDFNYACAPTPLQHGIVEAVRNNHCFGALKDV